MQISEQHHRRVAVDVDVHHLGHDGRMPLQQSVARVLILGGHPHGVADDQCGSVRDHAGVRDVHQRLVRRQVEVVQHGPQAGHRGRKLVRPQKGVSLCRGRELEHDQFGCAGQTMEGEIQQVQPIGRPDSQRQHGVHLAVQVSSRNPRPLPHLRKLGARRLRVLGVEVEDDATSCRDGDVAGRCVQTDDHLGVARLHLPKRRQARQVHPANPRARKKSAAARQGVDDDPNKH
mmetsp:Transcript_55499/g.140662  ORF Transcript_55499/g.140662 Transcript_55499/m.140662 type:complete len:232 (+) Transcript_55499:526-1221(+)